MQAHLLYLSITDFNVNNFAFVTCAQVKIKRCAINLLPTKCECSNIFIKLYKEVLCLIEIYVNCSVVKILYYVFAVTIYHQLLYVIVLVGEVKVYANYCKIGICKWFSTRQFKDKRVAISRVFAKHLHAYIILWDYNVTSLLL